MTLTGQNRNSILELDSGHSRPLRDVDTIIHGPESQSSGYWIEEHSPNEARLRNVCLMSNAAVLNLDGIIELEWSRGTETVNRRIRPGQLSILPANDPYSVHIKSSGRSVFVMMDEKITSLAALEQGCPGEMKPNWAHGVDDPFLRELILELMNEHTLGAEKNFGYIESLIHSLAAQLIRRYSSDRLLPAFSNSGGLSPSTLKKAIGFIHENLQNDISIGALAEVVGLSTAHFARMFKNSTDMSPHQYILLCRINKAKKLLMNRSLSLAQISASTGFCDQSHFTRSFQKIMKTTPSCYAKSLRSSNKVS